MKRNKLYFQIGSTIIISIVFVVFVCCTFYFLHINNLGTAGIYASLIGVSLTIAMSMWALLLKKHQKDTLIEKYLNDEHFVDRDIEYIKLLNLIQHDSNRIIYITGKFGMGKTLFMKMSCDRINYSDKKNWKSYAAFYYNNNHTKMITHAISNRFCGHPNASVSDISKKLSNATLQKNTVLFIDNIYDIDLIECREFANAFINCGNNYVVVALDGNADEIHICPGKFGEHEVDLLANSYNVKIEQPERYEISELSNGYPVYARYSVEAFTRGINILEFKNLDNYIETLINSLNDLEKSSLSLIICLTHLLQDGVRNNTIYGINNRITKPIIKRLITSSLINEYKEKIFIDKLISLKSMDFLSEYKNDSYEKIYLYYKGITNESYIALAAALKSDFKYDAGLIKEFLHQQYKENNFYLLIDIGEMECSGQINPYLREDKECWSYVRYYYLKSLLELGLYDRAREAVDTYDNQLNILNMNTDIDFEYQYLLVDLDHLTNYLEDAVTFSEALLHKTSNKSQIVKCQYLYAHCLRHIGTNLNLAYSIFTDLANRTDYYNDKIRIRSLYSSASIKMFQGEVDYPYEKAFDEIEQIICKDEKNEVWKPYVARHKAIYEYKICKDFKMAEYILQDTIRILEVTPLRIKYDIYFELGELYRMSNHSSSNYEKSTNYYIEAVQFAKRVHDYNLQSSSQLGIMLLNIKYGFEIEKELLISIIRETHKMKLNINYNYAQYVKYLADDKKIPEELVDYWRKMQYSDLLSLSFKSKSEKCSLKLTVM